MIKLLSNLSYFVYLSSFVKSWKNKYFLYVSFISIIYYECDKIKL